MTQFATRVFFDVAKIRGLSAAAVFCDLAAAYYSVIRQYVVGTGLPEQRLLVVMDILGLDPVQIAMLLAFLRAEGSLLKSAGTSPALQQLVRDMNEDTRFSLEGSSKITGMFGGCRPGEPTADLVVVFMFCKVLMEVILRMAGCWPTMRVILLRLVHASAQQKKMRRHMLMILSISSDMRILKSWW